ncbi:hypothetical protein GCM10023196_090130 [Actinoallomurus vinaceus]|uniref:Uncharacterized protein n=1 Tax=Actinoallomurus vinaceus TaxID=1080074 RepID=A0ABP8UQ39_9ACTN
MIRNNRRPLGREPTGLVWSPVRHVIAPDPSPQDLAALQATCRGWAVMWSRWRRAYTAFALFTAEPLIVDEPDPECYRRLPAVSRQPIDVGAPTTAVRPDHQDRQGRVH